MPTNLASLWRNASAILVLLVVAGCSSDPVVVEESTEKRIERTSKEWHDAVAVLKSDTSKSAFEDVKKKRAAFDLALEMWAFPYRALFDQVEQLFSDSPDDLAWAIMEVRDTQSQLTKQGHKSDVREILSGAIYLAKNRDSQANGKPDFKSFCNLYRDLRHRDKLSHEEAIKSLHDRKKLG